MSLFRVCDKMNSVHIQEENLSNYELIIMNSEWKKGAHDAGFFFRPIIENSSFRITYTQYGHQFRFLPLASCILNFAIARTILQLQVALREHFGEK